MFLLRFYVHQVWAGGIDGNPKEGKAPRPQTTSVLPITLTHRSLGPLHPGATDRTGHFSGGEKLVHAHSRQKLSPKAAVLPWNKVRSRYLDLVAEYSFKLQNLYNKIHNIGHTHTYKAKVLVFVFHLKEKEEVALYSVSHIVSHIMERSPNYYNNEQLTSISATFGCLHRPNRIHNLNKREEIKFKTFCDDFWGYNVLKEGGKAKSFSRETVTTVKRNDKKLRPTVPTL